MRLVVPLQKSYNPPFVRILLLSDIHSNLEALDSCLAAAPAHDLVVNLGDTVGYGGNPNEVIARSQALGHVFVRGNHDKAVCGLMNLEDFNPVAGLPTLWPPGTLLPKNPNGPPRCRRVPSKSTSFPASSSSMAPRSTKMNTWSA